jgi:hypothetical protein
MSSAVPIVNLPFMYVNNLIVSNNAVTPNTKIDVSSGQCRDSTNVFDMTLSSGVTISSASTGVNGLDSGSQAASTWYAVYVIGDALNGNPTAAMISTSATAPVMPYGYNIFRLIGWMYSDSSTHFSLATIVGSSSSRKNYWTTAVSVLSGGTSASLALVDLTTAIPALDNVTATISTSFTPATAGDYVSLVASNSTVLTGVASLSGVVAAKAQVGQLDVLVKLSSSLPQIKYINSAASGATTLYVDSFTYTL